MHYQEITEHYLRAAKASSKNSLRATIKNKRKKASLWPPLIQLVFPAIPGIL
jgi:hypothetical protein